MKGLFPEYSEVSDSVYKRAWKEATFVFDTNVLLNLYRYQAQTREELLTILAQLTDRIWIPHHVALEFQRNRLRVIADQGRRFSDVKNLVEKSRASLVSEIEKLQLKKRHSSIDPTAFISGFEELSREFLSNLDGLTEVQQGVTGPDPIRQKLEDLFDGNVGAPPRDQPELEDIYKRAEQRFKFKIPPGFEDRDKDKSGPDEHLYGSLVYKRKFADFLIWDQLLSHAREAKITSVIFVTDDGKDDWWNRIEAQGPKTIGPRPELINEARVAASIDPFLMYDPEGFLKYARELLSAQVSDSTLSEVRDFSKAQAESLLSIDFVHQAETAVSRWLRARFGDDKVKPNSGLPDLMVSLDGSKHGYEVRAVRNPGEIVRRIGEFLTRDYPVYADNSFTTLTLVLVVNNDDDALTLSRRIRRSKSIPSVDKVRILIGVMLNADTATPGFIPTDELLLKDRASEDQLPTVDF